MRERERRTKVEKKMTRQGLLKAYTYPQINMNQSNRKGSLREKRWYTKARGTCRVALGRKPMVFRSFKPYTPLFMLPQWIHTSGVLAAIAVKAGWVENIEERRWGLGKRRIGRIGTRGKGQRNWR